MIRTLILLTTVVQALVGAQVESSLPPGILPANAVIIETAKPPRRRKNDRILALWMSNPKREVREPADLFCGNDVYGDNWVGPARLSLIDPIKRKIVNTISIEGATVGGIPGGSFRFPFRVPNGYYHVPTVDSKGEGKPNLLYFRDLTGDGLADEFVLVWYVACGIVETSVFGYEPRTDRAIQYPIEVTKDNEKPQLTTWVWQIFAYEPNLPGQWDISWKPGHGSDVTFHEHVRFDRARLRFVDHHTEDSKP